MSWLDDSEAMLSAEQETQQKISDATTWKPAEGDTIKGKLLGGALVETSYDPSLLLNIEDADGKVWTVWAGSKMLADAIGEKAPAMGKGVIVKFDGKKPIKDSSNHYNAYYLECEESDHEYWANIQRAFYSNAEANNPAGGSGAPADGMADPF